MVITADAMIKVKHKRNLYILRSSYFHNDKFAILQNKFKV